VSLDCILCDGTPITFLCASLAKELGAKLPQKVENLPNKLSEEESV
jgi:hypothetical protein